MHQRKKNQNKQNFKTIKKTTIQQINYTQQLHIPTFATMDLRQAGRSIQLKKSSSKKPASRKSRCISAKQPGVQTPLNLKQLLKQFKSMKIIQSRSKSPKQSKSKPKLKKSTKKILPSHTYHPHPHNQTYAQNQLNSKSKSEYNLIQKLQQTINKLKQTCYFKDEDDSEIPLISTSQAFTQSQKKKLQYIVSGENFQDINIRELRLFCKNKEPGFKMNLDYFKGNIYQIMARRIQRAWRRYCTHKLVQRYANVLLVEQPYPSPGLSHTSSQNLVRDREQMVISSQQFYRQQGGQRKITYISNLQQSSDQLHQTQKNEQSNTLLHIKLQQLQKWSQIVTIINSNRSDNPQETQKLLKKLMNKSQNNKRSLQRPIQEPTQIIGIGRNLQRSQQEHFDSNQNLSNSEQSEEQKEYEFEEYNNAMKYSYQIQSKYQRAEKRQQNNQRQKQLLKQKQAKQKQKDMERADPEIALQGLKKRLQQRQKQQKSSLSEDSIKQIEQQFNSKKYIEYLDSDMYPIANHPESLSTIGIKKQQELLHKLTCENSRKFIRGPKVLDSLKYNYQIDGEIKSRLSCRSGRSNSVLSSASSIDAQQLKSSRKSSSRNSRLMNAQIRKSISEKSIRYGSDYKNSSKIGIRQQQKKQENKMKQLEEQLPSPKTQTQKPMRTKKIQKQQIRIQRQSQQQQWELKQLQNQRKKKQERSKQIKKLELPNIPSMLNNKSQNIDEDIKCLLRRQLQYQQIDQQLQPKDYQKYLTGGSKAQTNKNENANQNSQSLQFQQLSLEQDRNLQKAYLQQQFYNKIRQYNKLKQQDSDVEAQSSSNPHNSNITKKEDDILQFFQEIENTQVKTPPKQNKIRHKIKSKDITKQQLIKNQEQNQDLLSNQGDQLQPVLHRSQNQNKKVQVQNYDRDIQSEEGSSGQQIDKSEQISILLVNSLALQFLIQMAKYTQTILKSFKKTALKKAGIKRAPKKAKKNGFPTNQTQIKSFIQGICNFVIDQQPQIFKNLQRATGPSALQMLRYMHQSVQNDIYIEEEQDDPTIMILPHWIFQSFWKKKMTTIKYQRQILDEQREEQRQQYIKGLNKIFLRSCFDCLNQCLDYERNFGPFGKPFPWKSSHFFNHIKTYQQTKRSVKDAQKRLFDISSIYCGIIVQKQQIASIGANQQYITQIQQDRLSRMLAQDIVEGEQRWIFYDDEQTELLVEASHTIFHQLIQEIAGQLIGLLNIFS